MQQTPNDNGHNMNQQPVKANKPNLKTEPV